MINRLRHLAVDFALLEAGWMIVSFSPDRKNLWAKVTLNGISMVTAPPKLRTFWYRPAFWRYVWKYWRAS
jgi:hypothetical protein